MDEKKAFGGAFRPGQVGISPPLPVPKPSRLPDVIAAGRLPDRGPFVATARMPGAKLDTARLADDETFQRAAAASGLSFVFRYGVVVTFATAGQALDELDAALGPRVLEPAEPVETETASVVIRPDGEDRLTPAGNLVLVSDSHERLLLVATLLSQSVALARSEYLVSEAFERSSEMIAELHETGRTRLSVKAAMKLVGNILAARHRLMGMVQVGERPDMLWDFPALERLYVRLEAEYEISERAEVLDRKFIALGDFATALLEIIQEKRAVRLEVAIIVLIALEGLLFVWDIFLS
jgi:uncharacterized Rmd1/YagE family protein